MENRREKKLRFTATVGLLAMGLLVSACASKERDSGGASTEGKLQVMTTIAQIAEPLSVIGGEHVSVQSLMGPGVDPHLYNATQGDIRRLEQSDVVFYNGLDLEINMVRVFEEIGKSKPVLAIGDTLPDEALLRDETGAVDPHIWFDLDLWKDALDAAVEQLKEASQEHADIFEANKTKYFAELESFKEEAQQKLSAIPQQKRVLITAHDAFGYFGRLFDIDVVGLQGLSTEDEIGLSDIDDTIKLLLDYKVPAVFVETSINPASIEAVIEGARKQGLDVKIGGHLYSDAMGDAGTAEGTYLGMYRHNVDTIAEALKGGE